MKLLNSEEFNKLNKLEKRVAISRDVVARLNAKKLKALPLEMFSYNTRFIYGPSLQNTINKKTCEACAKGALCISYIGNFNHYNDLNFSTNVLGHYPEELKDIFGIKLLDVLEIAFEGCVFRYSDKAFTKNPDFNSLGEDTTEPRSKTIPIINAFKSIKNANKRMKAIFQNIIDNGGKLKIGDKLYG